MTAPKLCRFHRIAATAIAAAAAAAPCVSQGRPAGEITNVSGGPLRPGRACYDVRHYTLHLTVDPERRTIDGVCRMVAEATAASDSFELDLDPRLKVHKVESRDKPVEFVHKDGVITVTPGRPLQPGSPIEVSVFYGGAPRVAPNPPWNGGFTWAETPDGAPWIATSCQGEGADLWWPCKDHPSDEADTMNLYITVPAGLEVASNGVLQGIQDRQGGSRTFHWFVANPINNYGVALNIAPYVRLDRTYRSVANDPDDEPMPVHFWVLPGNEEKGEKVLDEFIDHIAVMEQLCGPYPFRNEKYGVVETPHLGMEHQTIIAYGYGFKRHRLNYDWLHQHEMAHEWWANQVTCSDWRDMWIHEGIGTYMQPLYLEHSTFSERGRGVGAYRNQMLEYYRQIANRRPIAPREVTNSKEIYFGDRGQRDSDIYYKGAWVCHSLRWLLGDDVFFKVLRRWAYPDPALEKVTDGSQTRITDTDELIAIAEAVADVELDWFFEVYLRRGPVPRLEWQVRDGTLHLRWTTPDDLPFPMPVPVLVDGEVTTVTMQDGTGQLVVGDNEYEVDPELRILRAR